MDSDSELILYIYCPIAPLQFIIHVCKHELHTSNY